QACPMETVARDRSGCAHCEPEDQAYLSLFPANGAKQHHGRWQSSAFPTPCQ
ncbi:Succinate--CoA ligase, partial [Clarias magur]